jgi:hypothetical protein
MTEEQRKLLSERLEHAAEEQPELLTVRDVLLRIGGSELVAPASKDPVTPVLLSHGSIAG